MLEPSGIVSHLRGPPIGPQRFGAIILNIRTPVRIHMDVYEVIAPNTNR